jgi:hypothetical protein
VGGSEYRLSNGADLAAKVSRALLEVEADTRLPSSLVYLVWEFMSRDPALKSADPDKQRGIWPQIGLISRFKMTKMAIVRLGWSSLERIILCYAGLLNRLAGKRLLRVLPLVIDRGIGPVRMARIALVRRKGLNADALIDLTIRSTEKVSSLQKFDVCNLMLSAHYNGALPLNSAQLERLIRASVTAVVCPVGRPDPARISARRQLLLTLCQMKADLPSDLVVREYAICLNEGARKAQVAPWLARFLPAAAAIGAPITIDLAAAHRVLACGREDGTAIFASAAAKHFMLAWLAAGQPDTEGPVAESLAWSWHQLSSLVLTSMYEDVSWLHLLIKCLAAQKIVQELNIDSDEEYRLSVLALRQAAGVLPAEETAIEAVFENVMSAGIKDDRDVEELASVARVWLGIYKDLKPDIWIRLGLNYCGYFRNIDNTAVSTLAERLSLLDEMRSWLNGRQEDYAAELHPLVLYMRCETLSNMGYVNSALKLYDEVRDKLSRSHTISDGLRWEINHNHLRNALFSAVSDENAHAVKAAYTQLLALGPDPSPDRDGGLGTLATKATTLSAVLTVIPFQELKSSVAEILEEALNLDVGQLPRLGVGSLALAKLSLAMLEDMSEPDPELIRFFQACRTRAVGIAVSDERVAAHIRELDLYAALAESDMAAARDQFLSIIAHNDLGLLKTQTMHDLLSGRSTGRALLYAVDRIAIQGQFGLAAWLLDQVPCRAVRLAVTHESDGGEGGFRWDESTWPSILGYAAHPSIGEDTDITIRFWVYNDSLQLLAGSSELLTISGFAKLSAESTVLTSEFIRSMMTRRTVVVDGEVKRTAETAELALGRLTGRAVEYEARLITVDFSGHIAALPIVHEVLRYCQDRAVRPMPAPIVTRPGTRTRPAALRRWGVGIVTHLGDWSGTLVGPWIEAAYAKAIFSGRARTLYPVTRHWPDPDTRDGRAELLIVSSHGYYANESGAGFGQLSFGSVSVGIHESIDGKFGTPRVALLASCEVGRGHSLIDQRNGMSLPAILLHKGVEQVTSPVTPVDDLASCILITRTLYALNKGAEAPDAVLQALDTIKNWSEQDVTDWGAEIMTVYAASPISRDAPWPIECVREHVTKRLQSVSNRIPEMLRTYVVTSW